MELGAARQSEPSSMPSGGHLERQWATLCQVSVPAIPALSSWRVESGSHPWLLLPLFARSNPARARSGSPLAHLWSVPLHLYKTGAAAELSCYQLLWPWLGHYVHVIVLEIHPLSLKPAWNLFQRLLHDILQWSVIWVYCRSVIECVLVVPLHSPNHCQ